MTAPNSGPLPVGPAAPDAAMAGDVRAQQRVLLNGDGGVHDGLRREVEALVAQRGEDLAEVILVEAMSGFMQGHGLDVDGGAIVGIDAPLEGIVVVRLVKGRVLLAVVV